MYVNKTSRTNWGETQVEFNVIGIPTPMKNMYIYIELFEASKSLNQSPIHKSS